VFCTGCGSAMSESALFCPACGTKRPTGTAAPSERAAATEQTKGSIEARPCVPNARLAAATLPPQLRPNITNRQAENLRFGSRKYQVVSSRVQTFQTGAVSKGSVAVGGLSRSLGQHWGAFGGLGHVNQSSISRFRTDIQLKLRDPDNKELGFISASVPFEITLTVDPGDTLDVFFARGGLAHPREPGDFRLDEWSPFSAQNLTTGQAIPLGPLPTLGPPVPQNVGCAAILVIVGVILLSAAAAEFSSEGWQAWLAFGIAFAGVGIALSSQNVLAKRRWRSELAAAQRYGAYLS